MYVINVDLLFQNFAKYVLRNSEVLLWFLYHRYVFSDTFLSYTNRHYVLIYSYIQLNWKSFVVVKMVSVFETKTLSNNSALEAGY